MTALRSCTKVPAAGSTTYTIHKERLTNADACDAATALRIAHMTIDGEKAE
jgi:hypothetical protein